jgi:hypothetical protein
MIMRRGGGITESFGIEAVPVPLYPPQIPHGLAGIEPSVSAVKGRRLTARVMARNMKPKINLYYVQKFSSYLTKNTLCFC